MSRRVFLALIAMVFTLNTCFADEDDLFLEKETTFQKQVMETGFRILNANNIEKRITFFYSNDKKSRVYFNTYSKTVLVNKGMFAFIENKDELAALLSLQIAYLVDIHKGLFKRLDIGYSPRKYELKEDKKAVDLMVNAGYNPVALIVISNKYSTDSNPWMHLSLEREKNIYAYIYEKYPIYLAENEYLETPYYQSFLYNSTGERQKIRNIQESRLKLRKQKKSAENAI